MADYSLFMTISFSNTMDCNEGHFLYVILWPPLWNSDNWIWNCISSGRNTNVHRDLFTSQSLSVLWLCITLSVAEKPQFPLNQSIYMYIVISQSAAHAHRKWISNVAVFIINEAMWQRGFYYYSISFLLLLRPTFLHAEPFGDRCMNNGPLSVTSGSYPYLAISIYTGWGVSVTWLGDPCLHGRGGNPY